MRQKSARQHHGYLQPAGSRQTRMIRAESKFEPAHDNAKCDQHEDSSLQSLGLILFFHLIKYDFVVLDHTIHRGTRKEPMNGCFCTHFVSQESLGDRNKGDLFV